MLSPVTDTPVLPTTHRCLASTAGMYTCACRMRANTPRGRVLVGDPKTHALYRQLRRDLGEGAFQPGERLSENHVAERYGVSRTPVREVLARLEAESLLTRVGQIITVPAPTIEQILDLFDTRALLEAAIARCAVERCREGDLVLLRATADRCRRLSPKADPAELYQANRDFHHALALASHNLVLADLQRQLDGRVEALRGTILTARGRWTASVRQHDAVLAAVEARDADTAAAIAAQHLREARELWARRLSKSAT
jgi:DNA-binding GntR family transcriptional regulator